MTTIHQMIDELHEALSDEDVEHPLDLAPSDVGRIVGLFFHRLARAEGRHPDLDKWLREIGDECMAVRDE